MSYQLTNDPRKVYWVAVALSACQIKQIHTEGMDDNGMTAKNFYRQLVQGIVIGFTAAMLSADLVQLLYEKLTRWL